MWEQLMVEVMHFLDGLPTAQTVTSNKEEEKSQEEEENNLLLNGVRLLLCGHG